MPPERKDVQQNSDGRWRMPVYRYRSPDGKLPYIYLGKMPESTARRVADYAKLVIEDSDDWDDCQDRVKRLAMLADRPNELMLTFREVMQLRKWLPRCTPKVAIQELLSFDGTLTDEQLEKFVPRWINASVNPDNRLRAQILMDLGFSASWVALNQDTFEQLTSGTILNPAWLSKRTPRELREIDEENWRRLSRPAWREMQRAAPAGDDPNKLSDCLAAWKERKQLERLSDKHIRHYEKTFKAFIAHIGDVPVNRLKKPDLIEWEKHLLRARKDRGVRWISEAIKPICSVLDFCRRKTDWHFPEALPAWFDCVERGGKHRPGPHNARRMPVETFRAALILAEKSAQLVPAERAKTLPLTATDPRTRKLQEANNLKQARRIQRAGLLWSAILRFAVNTDADNSDIAALEWTHLHLDEEIPFVNLARSKTAEYRQIPLLPSTVRVIKAWRDQEPAPPGSKRVFLNDAKRPLVSEKVWSGFDRIRDELPLQLQQHQDGNTWSFKHIRNVGTNVAKDAGIRPELREAFQGHAYRGMNIFYEEGYDFRAMIPIVNAIGRVYLDGDEIVEPNLTGSGTTSHSEDVPHRIATESAVTTST